VGHVHFQVDLFAVRTVVAAVAIRDQFTVRVGPCKV
jgi:hypothetical protein